MIQENINKLLTLIGVASLATKKSNKYSEKAEESLKENAQAQINQRTSFEEYKKTVYNETEEE